MSLLLTDHINQVVGDIMRESRTDPHHAVEYAGRDAIDQLTAIQSLQLADDERDAVIAETLDGLLHKAEAYVDLEDPTAEERAFVATYQQTIRAIQHRIHG